MMPSNSTAPHPEPPAQSKKKKHKNDSMQENSILLKLLEGCAKHKRRHETGDYDVERNDDDNEKMDGREKSSGKTLRGNKKCRDELRSLAPVLPRVENCIYIKATNLDEYHFESCENGKGERNDGNNQKEVRRDGGGEKDATNPLESRIEEDDVKHLCALYRAIARGAFCPLAACYLFGSGANCSPNRDKMGSNNKGDLVRNSTEMLKGIMPKILQLLRHLAMDPERAAFLFVEQLSEHHRGSGPPRSVREEVGSYLQYEDVGATIAALLNLVDDNELRLSAANDLITVLKDLHTVEESGVLFDPSMACELRDSNRYCREGKIKIHLFSRISDYLQKESNNAEGFVLDRVIGIFSRRSLLALQLGIWTALYHFTPTLFTNTSRMSLHDEKDNFSDMAFVTHERFKDKDTKRNLQLSVMSCARTSLLSTPRLPLSYDQHISLWRYSNCDMDIHSLLELQTKLVILGILVQGLTNAAYVSCDVGKLPWEYSGIELSVLSLESAKSHLSYQKYVRVCDRSGVRKLTMEKQLILWCTWGISEFVAHAVLFPDDSTQPRRDIWSYSLPHLVDCIPFIADYSSRSTDDEKLLCRVLLRAIHAIILQDSNNDTRKCSVSNLSQPSATMIDLFLRRCLAHGYLPYLFELITDSSGFICTPAISIIVYLLEKYKLPNEVDLQTLTKQTSSIDLVDMACSLSLDHFKASQDHGDRDFGIEKAWDSMSQVHKRTKLNDDAIYSDANRGRHYENFNRESPKKASSLMSSLTHVIGNGLTQSYLVMMTINDTDKANSKNKADPNMASQDPFPLREVAGTLRILLHFLPADENDDNPNNSIESVVKILFETVACVSETLTNQRSVNGDLCYLEPENRNMVAETIVQIGLQACRAEKRNIDGKVRNVMPREAISQFALSILPFLSSDESPRSNDTAASNTISGSFDRSCMKFCTRLCASIGITPKLQNGVCLCRLSGISNNRLSSECGDMALDESLPLSCR